MSRDINIRSQGREQVDAIPPVGKNPVVQYIPINKSVLVQTADVREVIKFPILGFSLFSFQLYAEYPIGALPGDLTQLYYELVGYRNSAPAVMVSSGVCCPFGDQVDEQYQVLYDSIALRLSTPNTGTSIPRPVVATYSVLGYP